MKQTILLGATVAVVLTAVFVYVPRESSAPQTIISVQSLVTDSTTQATLKVDDKTYLLNITQNETAISAMRALASADTFTFTGREYPGLGFFVDSINEKKSGGGNYWVFYVNGVSASMGVSATLLQAGDIIEWKYEKGY